MKPRGPELLYHEYPKYYKYQNGKFIRRKNTDKKWQLGRLHTAHPSQGQRWYLRILLTHVRGATGYSDLLTYKSETGEDVICKCFKERCKMQGLLKDDKEWDAALAEAADFKMPQQLRRLFAMIVKECNPQDANELFNKHKHHMIEDFENEYRKSQPVKLRMKEISPEIIKKMHNTVMYEICSILESYNVKLSEHDMSECFKREAKIIAVERTYDVVECEREYEERLELMNTEQESVLNELIDAIYDENKTRNSGNLFFIDAPGGTVCSYLTFPLYRF